LSDFLSKSAGDEVIRLQLGRAQQRFQNCLLLAHDFLPM